MSLTLTQAREALDRGELSAVELTRQVLDRVDRLEPRLHAYLAVDRQGALEQAARADERRARGEPRSAVDGIPVAVKDNLATTRLPTTAGSRILEGYRSPFDATAVARLLDGGAVLIGKTNLDEFGMGSSTETGAGGATHNPWRPGHTPGGSSGGSAAAVAAGLAVAALGSDTGGSVRQPAALTGTVGLKPTWGRVSRWGLFAYASSLDQVGTLTRTVRDAAAVLELIAGQDPADATSSPAEVPRWSASLDGAVAGLRVGLPREYRVPGLQPEVAAAVDRAAAELTRQGATVVEVSLPHTRHALAAYYLIATSEASSNLGRYDGVRYGHRTAQPRSLAELYRRTRSEGLGDEVKRRILLGTFALSAGYHEAYYLKAQQVRTLVRRDFAAAFATVDVLLSATSPLPAWPLGDKLADPLAMYLMDVLTVPASLAGLPAISVPGGLSAAGLPLGVQLIGAPFEEGQVLRAAQALENGLGPWPSPPEAA